MSTRGSAAAVARAAVECGEAVWLSGGADFQHGLLVGGTRAAAAVGEDALLLEVMELVESREPDPQQQDQEMGVEGGRTIM